ncbi:DNA primase large subunit [Aplysia californica]|uniref:DNA primase large subunit n=1 Tax=Aplysia californica TaxID=6500 RepID=A0ABM0JRQ9_APLCA|nr:DNA primase large subunit [Aplysia californica]
MDFGNRSKARSKVDESNVTIDEHYPHRLQLYSTPPSGTISLQEFEELAVERLKVLKAVETIGITHQKGTPKYLELLTKEISATKLKDSILQKRKLPPGEEVENRVRDHISHFILRLAYCRSEDLRRWFLTQELDLFRFRFQEENTESKARFLKCAGLKYKPVSTEERDSVVKELDGTDHLTNTTDLEYYKVPFTEALDLVRGRKVFLRAGFAYVPRDDLVSILLSVFRVQLSHALAITARALPGMEEDGRLLPMLCGLSKRYLGQDYSVKKQNVGVVTADMIDMLSKKSFPLCMQNVHVHLKQSHHLRHGSRLQYGLFLKGIGLSLEEAVKYFRIEFMKSMDVDTFDKKYSYGIRYNYGKEGKKTDYTPFGCMKIIMNNPPATGDSHGCPFRHFDTDLLKQRISSQGLTKEGVETVMKYTKGGHCQVACAKYFELTHGISDSGTEVEMVIQHPNQYFERSQKLLNGPAKPSSTPRTVKIVSSQSSTPGSSGGSAVVVKSEPIDEDMDDDMGFSATELASLDEMAAA